MHTVFELVKANQAELPVRRLCQTLRVSPSGYYAWLGRAPSARAQANVSLLQSIREAHLASDQTYGMPRIRAELTDQGITASRKRIARLMHDNHLHGVSRRRGWCITTERHLRQRPAPDLVQRRFVAHDINQLWVADMTYVPTWEGFLYLAAVTDVFSRKVVGWAFGVQMTSDLVIAALDMALFTRKPQGVIHHSDQGSQYTSIAFGNRCQEMKVRPSMGTVGDAYDNAMAESFFATLECELIARRTWETKTQARLAIFTWIETWYNPHQRHSGLGQMSPINFEKQQQEKKQATSTSAITHPHPSPTQPPAVAGRLTGRRIVVTGAASGIGRATAELFCAAGAKVAQLDRREPAPLADGSGCTLVADISDPASVSAAIAQAAQTLGGIDGLVNAAGVGNADLAEDITLEDWQRLLDVNLTGTFLVCRACLTHLRAAAGGATIVTIASGLGLLPFKRRSAYAASKAGVIALSRAIAMEWAPEVRVNTVCPGTVDTPMVRAEYGEEALRTQIGPRYALQRISTADEIALAALYLSSAESAFVTGVALAVDGGRTFH